MSEAPFPSPENPADKSGHEHVRCPNCYRELKTKFCAHCGQKKIHRGDLSLEHAWHHLVHEIVHVDGKIFQSLKLLYTRPGQLTLDFLAGRRARHVHPIRLFLVIGFAYFLFTRATAFVDLSAFFADRTSQHAIKMESILATKNMTLDQFVTEANERNAVALRTIDTAAILFQGFWLWIMFRKQRPFLAENMVMMLHLACFNMTVWLALSPLTLLNVSAAVPRAGVVLLGFTYFLFAARRVYGGSWWSLGLKGAVLQLLSIALIYLGFTLIIVQPLFGR